MGSNSAVRIDVFDGSVPKASKYQCKVSAIFRRAVSRYPMRLFQRTILDRSSPQGNDSNSVLTAFPMVKSTPGRIHRAPPSTFAVVKTSPQSRPARIATELKNHGN